MCKKISLIILLTLLFSVAARTNFRMKMFEKHHGKNLSKRSSSTLGLISMIYEKGLCSTKTCQKCHHFIHKKGKGEATHFCSTVLALPGCCSGRIFNYQF